MIPVISTSSPVRYISQNRHRYTSSRSTMSRSTGFPIWSFRCLPFGIVAIVFAAKINSSVAAGDYEAAEKAAKTAKIWIIVAVAVGVIWNIIQMVLFGGLMDMAYYYY